MNISQANKISIKQILESASLYPTKYNPQTAFYFAIDREEKTPSLSVNYINQTAFDFGTGKKYDNVSLVQAIKLCSVSEALQYLSQFNFNENIEIKFDKTEPNYNILEVKKEVTHPALIKYLNKRKIWEQRKFLQEIHYEVKNSTGIFTKYFAVAFGNNSPNSYEISSSIWKGCLGKKDLTLIKNHSGNLKIFESFIDFLSFKIIERESEKQVSDYLILNSVYLLNKIKNEFDYYNFYRKIDLLLDNDKAGKDATSKLLLMFSQAKDKSYFYKDSKDINEYLVCGNHLEKTD